MVIRTLLGSVMQRPLFSWRTGALGVVIAGED
jgi:hypothetical protein